MYKKMKELLLTFLGLSKNKYKLTKETNDKGLFRIKALKSFGNVNKGDLGGFVEKVENLSQKGNCWVYKNAHVYDNAIVYDNACVYDNAQVYNNAWVSGNARVSDNARVYNNAWVYDDAKVSGNAKKPIIVLI